MPTTFWTHTIWFILLGITTIIQVVYIMVKAENRRLMFTFYLTVSGMVYLMEVFLFGILRAYDYYPMIFHQISALDDSLAGNIFSQFSLAASALLISFLNLKYYWYIIIALAYGGIEELFLFLGIYKHHWYQTWMTVVGLVLLFIIIKIMYNNVFGARAQERPGRIFKYILIYFAVVVPFIFLSWPFRLFEILTFSLNKLPNPIISGMLLFAINYSVLTNIIMPLFFLKAKWWWNGIIILFLYIAYYIAGMFNYIESKNIGILMLFATLQIFGTYLFVYIFDRLYD